MKSDIAIPAHHQRILRFVKQYFSSLQRYRDHYLPQIYAEPYSAPEHYAYFCPLCMENFILIDPIRVFVWTCEFTFDHFPQQSVGGTRQILVCKTCNNKAGFTYEPALKQKLERMSFGKGIIASSVKVTTKISGVPGNYKSRFFINEDAKLEMDLKPKKSSHTPDLDKWIRQSPGTEWEAKVTIPNPNETDVSKSLVKSAYLCCFEIWGYEFAFSDSATMMRKYLQGEEDYPIRTPLLWLAESISSTGVSHFPTGTCYLQKPISCKSLAVNLELRHLETNFRELAVVLIPPPTADGWHQLQKIQERIETTFSNGVDIAMAHVVNLSVADGILDGYHRSWEILRVTTSH